MTTFFSIRSASGYSRWSVSRSTSDRKSARRQSSLVNRYVCITTTSIPSPARYAPFLLKFRKLHRPMFGQRESARLCYPTCLDCVVDGTGRVLPSGDHIKKGLHFSPKRRRQPIHEERVRHAVRKSNAGFHRSKRKMRVQAYGDAVAGSMDL